MTRETTAVRALIVDDDPGILAVVEAVLVEEGFEVFTASDGEEALEAATTSTPDVVLLDVMMPRLDGIETCRLLRENPITAHICVVMLTARTFPANKLVGLGAGADDYVTKPFDPVDLPQRLRAAMRRNRDASALDPVTHLPGPRQFAEMRSRLVEEGSPFALLDIDLAGLEGFTERYGPIRADMAVRQLAGCVRRTIERTAGARGFVGHIRGAQLVAMVDADRAEATAAGIVRCWDAERDGVYDADDAAAGSIELERNGKTHKEPLMTVAVGAAVAAGGEDAARVAARAAAQMQQLAKEVDRSAYRVLLPDESPTYPADRDSSDTAADSTPLLRRARRRGVSPPLWDQLAAIAEASRNRDRRQVWLSSHPNSVVIVDDDEDVRDVLRLHCEIQGFPVVDEAADGVEAVRSVAQHLPAFVIMDYRMPNMDGAEAATHIRAVHPDVKIIAFSGVLHERPTWADDFLSKEQIAHITPLLGRFLEMGAGDRRSR